MLEIKDIRKVYTMGDNTLEVLKGVNLKIEDGDFVAIMGPSGSGKSTLMNILGLLDVPSTGSYQFNGKEISKFSEDELAVFRRDEIGFIFQQFNLLPRMSALENVALPLLYSKKEKGEAGAVALLEQVGLGTRTHHRPNELSGGQQQRVAIARSLVNRPKMILADEPTGNLDSVSEKDIMAALKSLNDSGITVVIVTHEEEIGAQAKRLIRMRDGVIYSDERLSDFKKTEPLSAKKESPQQSAYWDFLDYFKQGYKTLAANKVRTALSMLGILIGVAAVVAMLALGRGAQKAIEEQLSSLGSNLLTVRAGSVRVAGVTQEGGAANRLSYDDMQIMKSRVGSIKAISGLVQSRNQATANGQNWNTQVQAVSTSWTDIHNSKPVSGRFFTEDENTKRARVAVIGEVVRKTLFGDSSCIGEMIKIDKVNFQVIGVLPEKGASGWRNQDDVIIIPILTGMYRLMGKEYVDNFEIEIDKPENIDSAQDAIVNVMSTQHKVPLSQQEDAFNITNMADIQAALQQSSQTMSTLLASIAAISLLVGGIGIMNIMLVSVTERTKEIGLRKSIGARRNDILIQFLSESVVISVIGGVMGIILGWLATLAISGALGWSTSISLNSVLISFFFSALIGILFGVYPAKQASALNPIEALRYE
ncbi:MacB family efflux pump subunit [Bdellovibrio sp. qaytius]|nr:MacB family efflux pump subunit [Bdellovibrio sp. qaytius]